MAFIDKTREIAADVKDVYEIWTAFEDYPKFMATIETVTVVQDDRLHWVAVVEEDTYEWDADIVEHVVDEKITWRAVDGRETGEVRFEKLAADRDKGDLPARVRPRGLGLRRRDGEQLDEQPRGRGSRRLQGDRRGHLRGEGALAGGLDGQTPHGPWRGGRGPRQPDGQHGDQQRERRHGVEHRARPRRCRRRGRARRRSNRRRRRRRRWSGLWPGPCAPAGTPAPARARHSCSRSRRPR